MTWLKKSCLTATAILLLVYILGVVVFARILANTGCGLGESIIWASTWPITSLPYLIVMCFHS